ncbi:lectizyme [Teleopsis dalmanni]|uniref:lectizyme n=1 Tax=Teleopsis dalmanni TaxID=139649 RepID=UPI0018CEAFF5|nr:lectizyme [Teleopsis dalmanni]
MKVLGVVLLLAVAVYGAPPKSLQQALLQKRAPPIVDVETRIIAGEPVKTTLAPYIVSLSISSVAYAHMCAGTILNKEWVLTAAHCVHDLQNLNGDVVGLPIYAGIHDRSELEKAQVRYIDFAFSHKQFSGEEGSDDIALLHVSQPFSFDASVRSIALPYPNENFAGEWSTTYGWGLNSTEAVSYEKELQVARAEVLDATHCSDALPSDAPVAQKEICVRVAACFGDGGSPLVVERGGGTVELIGITSWGYLPCGYNGRPTVYTGVSPYVDWIAEVQWAYSILH